jgi:hypothetical protein
LFTLDAKRFCGHAPFNCFIIGAVHRLENPGNILLELIEVQTGGYLGEDDIIRTTTNAPDLANFKFVSKLFVELNSPGTLPAIVML